MLDAPGGLWLFIFLVTYEIAKAVTTRLWRKRDTGKEPE